MKYVLLIYQNPGAFEALPDEERDGADGRSSTRS